MRLFIAVPIPDKIKKTLAAILDPIKQTISHIKWVIPDNFHFTLLFLGETSDNMVSPVIDRLRQITASVKPFIVHIENFSCFPSLKRPRILFLSVDNGRDAIVNLAGSVRQSLKELGFADNKEFKPHLTIGRVKQYQKIKLESIKIKFDPVSFEADQIQLIQSILKPDGPVYNIVERFSL